MGGLHGRYPGGPSRRNVDGPAESPREKPRLATVSEIEGRLARGTRRHKRKARRKRLVWGLVFSLVVSGSVGAYLGFASHRTDSELAEEMRQSRAPVKADLETQADRLINEMWKSEALERPPRLH